MTEEELYVRHTVEWEIQNFMELMLKNGEELKSPPFYVGNSKFNLSMYPNGINEDCDGWISLYLILLEGDDCPDLDTLDLNLKAGREYLTDYELDDFIFSDQNDSWGYPKFCERIYLSYKFQIFSYDGVMTVECSFYIEDGGSEDGGSEDDGSEEAQRHEGVINLSHALEKLFLGGQHSDVKIKVRGRVFEAHKSILSARSSVLAAMFNHDMAEKLNCCVEIPDMDPDTFSDFLMFIYTGKFDSVTPQNAAHLFRVSDKYDLEDLKKECLKIMTFEPSVDTILDIFSIAVEYQESALLDYATAYFIQNASKIFTTDSWKPFFIENMQFANELLIKMAEKYKT